MRKPTNDAHGNIPAALWSGLIALWRAPARRPAPPLLLALLLFVAAPFAAPMDCSLEMGGHGHGTAQVHLHADAHPAHAVLVHFHGATLQTPASCCCCSCEPVNATFAPVSAPHQLQSDSHAMIYAVADALPTYRFDSLCGLNTRAGPPTGKPQRLSLDSLIGPAPPVSL